MNEMIDEQRKWCVRKRLKHGWFIMLLWEAGSLLRNNFRDISLSEGSCVKLYNKSGDTKTYFVGIFGHGQADVSRWKCGNICMKESAAIKTVINVRWTKYKLPCGSNAQMKYNEDSSSVYFRPRYPQALPNRFVPLAIALARLIFDDWW